MNIGIINVEQFTKLAYLILAFSVVSIYGLISSVYQANGTNNTSTQTHKIRYMSLTSQPIIIPENDPRSRVPESLLSQLESTAS